MSTRPATPARQRIAQVVSLIVALALMVAATVMMSGKLFGHDLTSPPAADTVTNAVTNAPDGSVIINTTGMVKKVNGFGGPVPVEITLRDGKVAAISMLPNDETPSFAETVEHSGIYDNWVGLTPDSALGRRVDAVSGATFTSKALIANVKAGLEEATLHSAVDAVDYSPLRTVAWWAALVVVLLSTVAPLLTHNKVVRLVQLIANVGVLGFWTGTFLSYAVMTNFLANGFSPLLMLTPVIMLIAAFLFPLFGRPNHYCLHVCPFGSLQELAGKCSRRKLHIGPRLTKTLDWVRVVLWCVLMLLMLGSLWVAWIPNEIFSAFKFEQASGAVVIVAAVFVVLSVFVPRPFCRFVCPTGTLFRVAESTK